MSATLRRASAGRWDDVFLCWLGQVDGSSIRRLRMLRFRHAVVTRRLPIGDEPFLASIFVDNGRSDNYLEDFSLFDPRHELFADASNWGPLNWGTFEIRRSPIT